MENSDWRWAAIYDAMYSFKDYRAEAESVVDVVRSRIEVGGEAKWLDVACGTGLHLEHWSKVCQVAGCDIDPAMIELAAKRVPAATLRVANMVDFNLGDSFDVVTCMFSSIGYAGTWERTVSALSCMADHLKPDGVLIVEPWLTPDKLRPNHLSMLVVDQPNLKVARISRSVMEDDVFVLTFDFLAGTLERVESWSETHRLLMLSHERMGQAFAAAGLAAQFQEEGPSGRGLWVATRADQEVAVR